MIIVGCLLLSLPAAAKDTSRRSKLLPDHLKVQYAGGIGFVSLGLGYQSRGEQLEGDFYYGYVPKSVGGVYIHAVSSKLTWHMVKKLQAKSFELRPLSAGLLVSYTFGKQYFLFWPENYPYSYYDFPTALHAGVFIGGRVDKPFKNGQRVGLYYELGSNDREISSYVVNRSSLKLTDILNLAIGIRTSF
ncbi:MAG TPA: hypothetical protein VGE66_04215 [Chitinophagaceae bacterium]